MEIRQLRYFITVVNEGNISNAARALNMSQPPLSTQIRQLEEELGCALFDRNTRHIQLTDAGRLLYERANTILDFLSTTQSELNDYKNGLSGTIRIGVVSSIGSTLFTDWIIRFHERYPSIRFALVEEDTYGLIAKTRSRQIDLALVRTPFSAPDLSSILLKNERMAALGQPKFFRDARTGDISLEELAALPLITYRRWEGILKSEFQAKGLEPNFICINDDARTTVYLAAAGLGVGIAPASVVSLSDPGGVTVRTIRDLPLTTGICLVYRRDAYLSSIARLFTEFAQKEAGT